MTEELLHLIYALEDAAVANAAVGAGTAQMDELVYARVAVLERLSQSAVPSPLADGIDEAAFIERFGRNVRQMSEQHQREAYAEWGQPVQPADTKNFQMTDEHVEILATMLHCVPRDEPALRIDLNAFCHDARSAINKAAQPVQPALSDLVKKVHKAKGRHHSQLAMCDLFDACGLSNFRPGKEPSAHVAKAVQKGRIIRFGSITENAAGGLVFDNFHCDGANQYAGAAIAILSLSIARLEEELADISTQKPMIYFGLTNE